MSVSEVTINVITLQRYLAILHPHFHRTKVTKKRLLIFEAFGCVGVIILILFFRTTKNTAGAVGVTLVSLFNAFAYTKIYLVVRKAARSRKQLQDLASDQKFTRLILFLQNIKHAKSSFMVVICFFILIFLPAAIAGPFYASADKFERLVIIIKDYSTLGVHYRDLQARVHEQETRNLALHEAQPSAVLNFEFLVCERVLVNAIMHEQRVLKTF